MRDPLANLANRRFLHENLDSLFQSVKESKADLICIVLDLDNFKLVNDTLGHAAGDELLVFLARLVLACSRREVEPNSWRSPTQTYMQQNAMERGARNLNSGLCPKAGVICR